MTKHLWTACRRFFIYQYFLPFVLLESLPLLIMSFNATVEYNLILNVAVDCVCMVFLAIGTWINLVAEVN